MGEPAADREVSADIGELLEIRRQGIAGPMIFRKEVLGQNAEIVRDQEHPLRRLNLRGSGDGRN
jgi:hypothetical protein